MNIINTAHDAKTFDFALDGATDHVYSLPMLENLPARDILAINKLKKNGDAPEQADAILDLLEKYCPGLTTDSTFTINCLKALMEAWAAASTVTLGE